MRAGCWSTEARSYGLDFRVRRQWRCSPRGIAGARRAPTQSRSHVVLTSLRRVLPTGPTVETKHISADSGRCPTARVRRTLSAVGAGRPGCLQHQANCCMRSPNRGQRIAYGTRSFVGLRHRAHCGAARQLVAPRQLVDTPMPTAVARERGRRVSWRDVRRTTERRRTSWRSRQLGSRRPSFAPGSSFSRSEITH